MNNPYKLGEIYTEIGLTAAEIDNPRVYAEVIRRDGSEPISTYHETKRGAREWARAVRDYANGCLARGDRPTSVGLAALHDVGRK